MPESEDVCWQVASVHWVVFVHILEERRGGEGRGGEGRGGEGKVRKEVQCLSVYLSVCLSALLINPQYYLL